MIKCLKKSGLTGFLFLEKKSQHLGVEECGIYEQSPFVLSCKQPEREIPRILIAWQIDFYFFFLSLYSQCSHQDFHWISYLISGKMGEQH